VDLGSDAEGGKGVIARQRDTRACWGWTEVDTKYYKMLEVRAALRGSGLDLSNERKS
jgi:hypothetical protein